MNPNDLYTSNVMTNPPEPQNHFGSAEEARDDAISRAKAQAREGRPVAWMVHHLVSGEAPQKLYGGMVSVRPKKVERQPENEVAIEETHVERDDSIEVPEGSCTPTVRVQQ